MDNIIIKYSDWFEDDGGFEKIKSDFKSLGDELVKDAKRIKDQINIFDMSNTEGIAKYEKEAEQLSKTFEEYGKSKKKLTKIENNYVKRQKASLKATELQSKNLAQLEEQLRKYKLDLKQTNTEQKLGIKTTEESSEKKAELRLKIKAVNKEINQQQKEIIESNKLSRKEEKLVKANITLQKERVETISDIRERLSALRLVAQQVNITTEEGKQQVKAYNDEINELTDKLSENSDKFSQSKINVGNYEESITNALKGTRLFGGELDVLNGIVDSFIGELDILNGIVASFIGAMNVSTKSQKANTKATQANQRATSRFTKSLKVLNKVAKASVILLLVTAIASLASVFSQGRAGVIATEKALARFNAVVKVAINLFAEIGKGILDIFGSIGTSIGNIIDEFTIAKEEAKKFFLQLANPLGGADDKIKEIDNNIANLKKQIADSSETNDGYSEGWNKITKALKSFGQAYDNAVSSIQTNDEAIIRQFEIADEIRKAELSLIGLRKQVRLLEIDADDSTRSLREQLESTDLLLEKRLELLNEEADIAKQQLALANAKARVDAQQAGFQLPEDEVEFARELLDLNTRLSERNGENVLDDTFLTESQEALKNYLTLLDEVDVAERENTKQRNEIQRDLFEQNLDLLIDLIDTEKNLSEQFVNDITKNFGDRIIEFNKFIDKFRGNAQKQLDEFTKFAEQTGKDLDFQIEFRDDGTFDILVNDTKLAVDNVVELKDQLQGLGLAEIPINRLREIFVETRNGIRDFRDLNRELTNTGFQINEIKENLVVGDDELESLKKLQDEINKIQDGRDFGDLSAGERQQLLLKLEQFERDKTKIQEDAEAERQRNRLKAINDEIKTVQQGSQRYFELLSERNDIERSLVQTRIERIQSDIEFANQRSLESFERFQQETQQIINRVLDEVLRVNREEINAQEDKLSTQEERLDEQRQRAQDGLANTLAFEQRERAKQELELIQQQKRLERLEKIKAVYSSYTNYANQGDPNALQKTIRDFALLEAITASFGDGGIVGVDGVSTDANGITRGRSHNKKGGVLAFHEGGEGFFSRKEVGNMGVDNFRFIKSIASSGTMDKNFFTGQQREFTTSVSNFTYNDTRLVDEMRQVKNAIESKPSQSINIEELVNGFMDITETVTSKNKTIRNHYRINKKRL